MQVHLLKPRLKVPDPAFDLLLGTVSITSPIPFPLYSYTFGPNFSLPKHPGVLLGLESLFH